MNTTSERMSNLQEKMNAMQALKKSGSSNQLAETQTI